MKKLAIIFSLVMVLGLTTLGNAALQNNGNRLIYDTDLNITWYDSTWYPVNYYQAWSWAVGLNVGGVTGWRLPEQPTLPLFAYEGYTNQGEMGNLRTEPGVQSYFNHVLFMMDTYYWSATPLGPDAYAYNFFSGFQKAFNRDFYELPVLVVHSGNVGAPVPIPAAIWLLGSGLVGLLGIRRRMKN